MVTRITEDGHLIPSSGVGNNLEYLDAADRSTHVSGTQIMNGIGGSGDFTCNAFASTFISPSVAKDDAMVVITEYGYADLRGLAPRDRVPKMIFSGAPGLPTAA